jgi:hypothetical protein
VSLFKIAHNRDTTHAPVRAPVSRAGSPGWRDLHCM